MARPALEQFYITYDEFWQAWNTGLYTYPTPQRDFFRQWSGHNSPGYPRKKNHNSLEVFRSKYLLRGYFKQRMEHTALPHVWEELRCIFATTPSNFVLPSGMPAPGDAQHILEAGMISRNKAIDKAQDMKVNLAQLIAERRQVERSMTDVVNRLSAAARAIKRRDIYGVRKALGYTGGPKALSGRLSQDWLAWQYGWKPLLDDVRGTAEHFARREMERELHFKAIGISKQTREQIRKKGSVLGWADKALYTYGEVLTRSKTVLEFTLTSEFAREGKELGLVDPMLLVWELVPYSFVVDWFLPIGDFLRRMDYTNGLSYHDGSTTMHTSALDRVSVENGSAVYGGYNVFLIGNEVANVTTLKLSRERHHPHPPRPILIPTIADAYTPTRFFNALALLRVAFNR